MSVRKPCMLTHIAADDPLIKIWGVVDHERYTMIETFLELHGPKLQHELDPRLTSNRDIAPGNRILVSTPPFYRRAEILQFDSALNVVFVRLIDFGGILSVKRNEVIFFPSLSQFQRIEAEPPVAEVYILFGAVRAKKWTKEEMEWAQHILRLPADIDIEILCGKPCLKMTFVDGSSNKVALTDLLVQRGMCHELTNEQMNNIMFTTFGSRHVSRQYTVPPPSITMPTTNSHMNSFSVPSQNFPSNMSPMNPPPGIGNQKYKSQESPPIPAQQQAQMCLRQFDVETLPEGSRHEVFLSHVLDGMNSFTVQLKKNVDEKLPQLMARINEIPPKPIGTTLLPGTVCLGKHSIDQVLCRAVVTTVLADSANLYFVDFGDSEIVPFGEIYNLPPTFINEKVMALRFTLANLGQFNLTAEKAPSTRVFEELVDREEPLLMVVTKPEMPLRQYCELFVKENGVNINIKDRILEKIKLTKPAEFKKIMFKQKSVANVIITHAESPIRFFVQLELNQSLMDLLTAYIDENIRTAPMKEFLFAEDVNENMAVCAKYSVDNFWYRGLVTDEPDDRGYVNIFFVDYGNEDKVHYSTLRIMNNEMISKFPMQAVECRLDLDAKLASKPEVVSLFTKIIEEEESYTMTVMNMLPGHVLLVELVDGQQRNVKDRLMGAFGPPAKPQNVTPPKLSQGNWRDRINLSNDGNYSAFHARDESGRSKNIASDVDELDKSGSCNRDFWNKRDDFSQSNGFASEKSNTWRGVANRHRSGDDTSAPNDRNAYGSNKEDFKRREDDRRPYGKRDNNDWSTSTSSNRDNDMSGKSSFKRQNDDDDRNSRDNRGLSGRDDRRGGGGFRKNDEFNSNRGIFNDRKPFNKRDKFNSESKTEEWNTRNDEWASSKPKSRQDDWGAKLDNARNDDGYQKKNDSSYGDHKWGSRSDNFSTPFVQLSEEYDKGAKLIEAVYKTGHQLNIIVSWFLNPVHFFVKPADDTEFRRLMESIQSDYAHRKPTNVGSLLPNDCVVARHTDNVIYRAKVMRNRPGAVLVNFVDYGNTDVAKQGQVWTISSEHCTIPNQSICCSLRNIVAAGESGQWPKNTDFDKYFGKNQYTISFVECREESTLKTWLVDLVDENGQNIADLLVADGIAAKTDILNSEDLYDLNLLQGQILTVYPGYVESSKKFFVHVEPPKVESIRLSILKLTENVNALKTMPVDRIKEGEFCIAPALDESYYRALIVSVNDATQQAQVVYIDYGDEQEVAFSSIRILPSELMIYNPQAVECALYLGESFTDDAAFEEAISEKDFIVRVMNVVDEKLLVEVYDINGVRLPYPVKSDESVEVLCPLPILRRFEKVNVTHIEAGTVYIQRSSDENCIYDLCDQLKEKYDTETLDKVEVEPNTFYAAKSSKFEAWYRCKLAAPGAKEVFYIDYGNTEPIDELLSVKPLDKKFFESPTFAVGVKTDVKFIADDLSPLIDALSEVKFVATFQRIGDADDEWMANLKCAKTGKTLAQFAAEFNCGELSQEYELQPKLYSVFDDWRINESRQVAVVYVNSPSSFYVHRAEDFEKITSMNESLQLALMKVLPVVGPLEGMGAVRAINDTKWYRAHISTDGKQAHAVDFGMMFTKFIMKKLPAKFLDQSNYTVECALDIESNGQAWTPDVVSRLKELVTNVDSAMAKLEYIRDNKRWVQLKIENTNVADMLINENLAKLKRHTVVVSYAVSLAEFYLQETASEDDLLTLGGKLQKAPEWETVKPIIGDLVAAKFVDDLNWYRAMVTKIEESLIHVKFVDYGNESTCEEVKTLPNSIKSIPYFAFHCALHPMPEDADALRETFVNFVSSFPGVFHASFYRRDPPMAVMLYCDGTQIDSVIRCEMATKIPSQSVAFTNVIVSHINSPSSFFVQAENVDLNVIANSLVDGINFSEIVNPQVGDLVAALFPDDDQWYRARVTKVENSVNVLFVDYGNCCDVTEFRELPNEVKNMPFAAKHCAFALPEGLERWPEAAKERFDELVCEGNTIFEMNVIEDGDPAFVELRDHGVKVADELVTLCKADITATSRETVKSLVVLSYANNLNEIWIQTNIPQLDEMTKEMENAESFDTLESSTVGALVAALYDDDGVWYRAKILEVNEEGNLVLFIDYGNEETVTQVKSLPEDLVKLPPLAKLCKLKGLTAETESQPMLTKLQDFLNMPFILAELTEQDNDVVVDVRFEDDLRSLVEELRATVPSSVQETEKSIAPDFPNGTTTAEISESSETINEVEVETIRVSETVESDIQSPVDSEMELKSKMSYIEIAEEKEMIDVERKPTTETAEKKELTEAVTLNRNDIDEVVDELEIEKLTKEAKLCEIRSVVDDLELPFKDLKNDEQVSLSAEPDSLQINEATDTSFSVEVKQSDSCLVSIPEETDIFMDSMSLVDEGTSAVPLDESTTEDHSEFSNEDNTISTKFSEDLSEDYYTAYSSQVENLECETLIADEQIPEFILEEELSSINDEVDMTSRSECETPIVNVPASSPLEKFDTKNEKPSVEERIHVDENESDTKIVETLDEDINETQSISLKTIEKTSETVSGSFALGISVDMKKTYLASQNESEPDTEVVDFPIVDAIVTADSLTGGLLHGVSTYGASETASYGGIPTVENVLETKEDWRKSPVLIWRKNRLEAMRSIYNVKKSSDDCSNNYLIEKPDFSRYCDSVGEVEQVPSTDDKTCHIIHVNSPSSFFVRQVKDLKRLEEMETELHQKSTVPLTEDIAIDSLVSVNIEKRWRRAKVVDKDDTRGYWVMCIDYGTENCSNNLYELPAEFLSIPPFALHCGLRLPFKWGRWPANVRREFDNITSKTDALFVVRIIECEDEITYVTLFKDGVNIGERLKLMSKDQLMESPDQVDEKISEHDE